MKLQIRKRSTPLRNLMHLFGILSNMWNTLPDSYFQNLIASMPKRIKDVRKNLGGRPSTSSDVI